MGTECLDCEHQSKYGTFVFSRQWEKNERIKKFFYLEVQLNWISSEIRTHSLFHEKLSASVWAYKSIL